MPESSQVKSFYSSVFASGANFGGVSKSISLSLHVQPYRYISSIIHRQARHMSKPPPPSSKVLRTLCFQKTSERAAEAAAKQCSSSCHVYLPISNRPCHQEALVVCCSQVNNSTSAKERSMYCSRYKQLQAATVDLLLLSRSC